MSDTWGSGQRKTAHHHIAHPIRPDHLRFQKQHAEDRALRAAESSPSLTRSPGHQRSNSSSSISLSSTLQGLNSRLCDSGQPPGAAHSKGYSCAQEGLGSWETTEEKSSPEQRSGSAALEAFCLQEPARGTAPRHPHMPVPLSKTSPAAFPEQREPAGKAGHYFS